MKIKTTTAFRMLNANRVARANAAKKFVVKSLTKAGLPSKAPVAWQYDAFETREQAESRLLVLEKLNPGMKFVIVEVQ